MNKIKIGNKEFTPPFKISEGNNFDLIVDTDDNVLIKAHWEFGENLLFIADALNNGERLERENERLKQAVKRTLELIAAHQIYDKNAKAMLEKNYE